MSALRAALVGSMLAATAASAQEFDPEYYDLSYKMLNTSNDPFRYYIDGRMQQPNTVLIGQIQTATDQAYQTWEAVSCAYPAFASMGLSTNNPQITNPGDPYDTFNVTAYWVSDPGDPYYSFALAGGNATMAAVPLAYAGTLYQCDIYINAVDFKWSTLTPTPSTSLDLESFLLHEIGHCIGLGHSEFYDDVMWASLPYGVQRRSLSTRDQQKVCLVAPQTGAVGSPCTDDASCGASNLKCVSPPQADGGTAPKMCSKGCEPGVPGGCDDPFVCKPGSLIAGSNGACLPSRGDFVTQVGAPCASATQCGSPVALCQPEGQLPSGFPAYQGGYCTQDCGVGQTPCPAGSECIDFGNNALRCMKSCRLGTGDCRAGYSCLRVDVDSNICIPSCHSNADCGGTGAFVCRTCDRICAATQNPSGLIGDLCQSNANCGPGQACITFANQTNTSICSQTCSTSSCLCPTGTTCHPLANGDRYCLKDCVSGACPNGLQCGLLPTGRACIAPCASNEECPVGSYCYAGQCTDPTADAGACVLCNSNVDAGQPTIGNQRPDAGSGGSSGGCGCQAPSGTMAVMLPLAWALFVIARRRRS